MTTYTDEQKAEAVELYRTLGPTEAARQVGASKASVTRWAQAAGVETEVIPRTQAATETIRAQRQEQRERIRTTFLAKIEDLLARMDEPHVDFKGKDAGMVTYPKATSSDVKNYATSAAILLDKFRLEMGEATGRSEHLDLAAAESAIDREIERLSAQLRDDS